MLKLQQRKQRGQADAASALSNGTSTALKFLETLKTQTLPDINEASRKPSHNRVDIEEHAMVLDRIHTENKHLLALLQASGSVISYIHYPIQNHIIYALYWCLSFCVYLSALVHQYYVLYPPSICLIP